jgi:hypothetical protein
MGQYDAATKRSLGRAKIRQDQAKADLLAAKLWTPKAQTKIEEVRKVQGFAPGLHKTHFTKEESVAFAEFVADADRNPPARRTVKLLEETDPPPFDPGSFNPRPLTYEALKLLDRVYRAAKARKT